MDMSNYEAMIASTKATKEIISPSPLVQDSKNRKRGVARSIPVSEIPDREVSFLFEKG